MLRRPQTNSSILQSPEQETAGSETGPTAPEPERRRQPRVSFEASAPEADKPATSGVERRRHPRVKVDTPDSAQSGVERRRQPQGAAEASVSAVEQAALTGADRRVGERRKGERQRLEALRAEVQKIQAPQMPQPARSGMGFAPWARALKPSRVLLLGIALLSGGLAAFLTFQQDQPDNGAITQTITEVVREAKTRVLVARASIGLGQRLTPSTVAWADWPEGSVRSEYVTIASEPDAISNISGAVARFEIFPGEPIREQKLARADQGYLSAVLAPGKRGVSVPIAAESASGGFIVPNDHVDVVLTRVGDFATDSKTILTNVRVIAIDARLGETGRTGTPEDLEDPKSQMFEDKAIATLELDPKQAEVIINAGVQGDLSLVLRSITDFAETQQASQGAANAAIRLSSPFWQN
jgi:pilus assembly protein CpaB